MSTLKANKPFIMTIFGASGDLTRLKLAPAIYALFEQARLPENFFIVGFSRSDLTTEQFRADFGQGVTDALGTGAKEAVLKQLLAHIFYFRGEYGDPAAFAGYRSFIETLTPIQKCVQLAYFSVPSIRYKDIIDNLAAIRRDAQEDIRLVLEKPFGSDEKSAEDIFHFALQRFQENQFYLLDHYLGKTTVRSIVHVRESNRILSHMMRGYEIANVQITAFEDFGIKERGSYYEQAGAIKDFVQSHLLQIFSLVTMSLPISTDAAGLQREKYSVLSAIEPSRDPNNVVIGQYNGYRSERGVAPRSNVETFVALRLFIDRLDWFGVPVYLRHGKALQKRQTYAVLELKKFPFQPPDDPPNRLIFEFSPFENLHLTLLNKQEDPPLRQEFMASNSLACSVAEKCLPPGHAPLILDALLGEKKYFLSFSEVLASWRVTDSITQLIGAKEVKLEKYATGSFGPESQHSLTKRDGFSWYDLPS